MTAENADSTTKNSEEATDTKQAEGRLPVLRGKGKTAPGYGPPAGASEKDPFYRDTPECRKARCAARQERGYRIAPDFVREIEFEKLRQRR
jgi:hypothetical protein